MPKLWNESINTHRQLVRDAVLDAAAAVVQREGLLALTMSGIAEASGIGRATLYKYFPDVEAVLAAWHERQIAHHLAELSELAGGPGDVAQRLEMVLGAFALMSHEGRGQHEAEMAALLHTDQRIRQARMRVRDIVRQLIVDGVKGGHVRDDVDPDELAAFALHALSAASTLGSQAAVRRLVRLTLAGLRPAS